MPFLVLFFCANMARDFSERKHYYIPVDRQLIEVTREVYIAYYQAERRERYLMEQEKKHGVVYVGALKEDYCPHSQDLKAETEILAVDKVYMEYLVSILDKQEKEVFRLCCQEGYSLRKAAEKLGIHYLKVRRILKHIREKLKARL